MSVVFFCSGMLLRCGHGVCLPLLHISDFCDIALYAILHSIFIIC